MSWEPFAGDPGLAEPRHSAATDGLADGAKVDGVAEGDGDGSSDGDPDGVVTDAGETQAATNAQTRVATRSFIVISTVHVPDWFREIVQLPT